VRERRERREKRKARATVERGKESRKQQQQ
jgi:hypothetical protein